MTSPAFIEKVVEILNGDNDKTEVIQSLPAAAAAAATNKAPIPSIPDKAPNPAIPDKAPIPLKPNAAPMESPLIGNLGNLTGQVNSMFPPPLPNANGAPIRPDSSISSIIPNEAPKPNIPMLPQAPASAGGGLFYFQFFLYFSCKKKRRVN